MWARCVMLAGLLTDLAPSLATSLAPDRRVVGPNEITWFSVSDKFFIAARADDSVGVWPLGNPSNTAYRELKLNRGEQPLALSPTTSKLAIRRLAPEDGLSVTIAFLDVAMGTRSKEISAPDVAGIGEAQFGVDDRVYCATLPHFSEVLCVDSRAVRLLQRVEIRDFVQTGWRAAPDLTGYVSFTPQDVVVRKIDGAQIWKRHVKDTAEPAHIAPPRHVVVAYLDEHQKFMCLALTDGKLLWETARLSFAALQAVSDDGTRQAFTEDKTLSIRSLPAARQISVPEVKGPFDAVFSPDGHFLFCLPALEDGKRENRDGRTCITQWRASHIMTVVETSTGKILRRIDLSQRQRRSASTTAQSRQVEFR